MREKKGSIGKTTARARGRVPFSGMQIMAAAIACLVIWNICLQVQLLRARPRMEEIPWSYTIPRWSCAGLRKLIP